MRRLAPALAAFLALAAPAGAAPGPGITDPKGDWPVASQDVLSAKLSSALAGKTPVLRAELQLAAAPDGRPATYAVGFSIGCHGYAFDHSWTAANGYQTALHHTAYCSRSAAPPKAGPDEKLPATVTLKGSTLVFEAPYVSEIKKGVKVTYLTAWGCAYACMWVGVNWDDAQVSVGDLAYGDISYVVGSDLPRR